MKLKRAISTIVIAATSTRMSAITCERLNAWLAGTLLH